MRAGRSPQSPPRRRHRYTCPVATPARRADAPARAPCCDVALSTSPTSDKMVGIIGDHISDEIPRLSAATRSTNWRHFDAFVLTQLARARAVAAWTWAANIGESPLPAFRAGASNKVLGVSEPKPLAVRTCFAGTSGPTASATSRCTHVGLAEQAFSRRDVDTSIATWAPAISIPGPPPDPAGGESRAGRPGARRTIMLLAEEVVDLVKVDVEGFELGVAARSVTRTLERHRPDRAGRGAAGEEWTRTRARNGSRGAVGRPGVRTRSRWPGAAGPV